MQIAKSLRKPLVLAGIGTGAVATYAYQVAIARVLGPEAFGLMATILAFMSIIGIVASGLSPIAAKSSFEEFSSKRVWKIEQDSLFRTSLYLTISIAVCLIAVSLFFGEALRLGRMPLILSALYIPMAAIFAIAVGRMQLGNKLMEMTWVSAGSASLKLLTILPIAYFTLGATSALLLLNVVSLFAVIAAVYVTRDGSPGRAILWDKRSLHTIIVLTIFWILSSSDLVAVKILSTDSDAGLYAAAVSLGRILIILSTIYVQYRFAQFILNLVERKAFSFRYLISETMPVVLLGFIIMFIFYFFGDELVHAIYGSLYLESESFLTAQAALAMLISINYLLLNFLIIRDSKFIFTVLICLTTTTAIAYLVSGTIAYTKLEILVISNLMLLSSICILLWKQRNVNCLSPVDVW